jgi:hypothetical protein
VECREDRKARSLENMKGDPRRSDRHCTQWQSHRQHTHSYCTEYGCGELRGREEPHSAHRRRSTEPPNKKAEAMQLLYRRVVHM